MDSQMNGDLLIESGVHALKAGLSRTSKATDVRFVIILGQGRSGSTLILRLLNEVPGVRISGENYGSLDHLRRFARCYADAEKNRHSAFYRLAWKAPCGQEDLLRHLRQLFISIHGPGRLIGFKEIRYGNEPYEKFADALDWMRELLPGLSILFNTRATETCITSDWWAKDPIAARRILKTMRDNFERYCREHPDCCYSMPYEELKRNSPVLRGMFRFLHIPWKSEYERPLDVKMRE